MTFYKNVYLSKTNSDIVIDPDHLAAKIQKTQYRTRDF